MQTKPGLTAKRSLALAASMLVPLVPLALLWAVNVTPAEVANQSLRLTGEWKVMPSEADGLGAPDVDDTAWKTIELPTSFAVRGFREKHHWVRRKVELPATVEPQFFMLGNTHNAMVALYVNGHLVGRNESMAADYEPDWTKQLGWQIPPQFLEPGANVIALKVYWSETAAAGLVDQRIFLGPSKVVLPYFARVRHAMLLFAYGSIFTSLLVTGLLLVLMRVTKDRARRLRFASTAGLAATVLFYCLCVTGTLRLIVPYPAPTSGWLSGWGMVAISLGLWNYVEREYLGRVTRLQLAHWVIVTMLLVVGQLIPAAVGLLFAYLSLVLVYVAVVSIRGALKAPSPLMLMKTVALFIMIPAGVLDLMKNLGAGGYAVPPVYAQALTDVVLMAALLLIVEFIDIARSNQVLSASLTVTNADLSGALARAQESTRVKSELLASVSHELRTPLNSIINVPEGLLEDFPSSAVLRCSACAKTFEATAGEPAPKRCPRCNAEGVFATEEQVSYQGVPSQTARYLRSIGISGRHLLSVVDDILDFSKLNATMMTLSLEELPVARLLNDVKETIEPIARQANITLAFPTQLPAEPLRADATRLRQVLLNLLSNAIKFSSAGGQVTVGLTREGPDYVFSVQDHGVGIAQEHQQVIFESFRQVEGGSTRRFGGTGLGLSIARELVVKHGGSLWVQSTLGQGSTFFFKVPLKGPPVTAAGLPVAIARPSEDRTILIVEDDATTLETIKLALRPLGFVLVGTTDPRGAMGLLRDLKPDLLVLDVMMPHLSGLELLRQLRASPDTRDTSVLVTSAYPANEVPTLELGARWVPKPWQPRQLAQAAVELLDATAIAPAA